MSQMVPKAFHALATADPLFAAEGMDVDAAATSIEDIESALTTLESEYAGTSFLRKLFFLRYPLPRHAVPISFLKSVVSSEKARRFYLMSPSVASACALVEEWERACHALSADLSRYRTLHDVLVRLESTPDTFVTQDMFGHLSTYRYIEKTLISFQKNARALRSEVAERKRLLEGGKGPLPRASRHRASVPMLQKGEISPWHAQLHEAEKEGGVWPYRYADIVESHGPFRIEMAHLDPAPRERTFMCYIMKEKETGRRTLWIAFVDRFYFIDIWHMVPKMDGVTRGKYATAVGLERGEIPFWYESIALLYNTRDARYWMDIASAVDAQRRPELDWALAAAQKSSLFDMVLAECARDARSMTAHLRRRARAATNNRYSLLYDLLTRSYPSVYYLPFNASVWRLPEEPELIGDGFESPPADKFLSEERMHTELTPEVLKKTMRVAKLREERGKQAGWLP